MRTKEVRFGPGGRVWTLIQNWVSLFCVLLVVFGWHSNGEVMPIASIYNIYRVAVGLGAHERKKKKGWWLAERVDFIPTSTIVFILIRLHT